MRLKQVEVGESIMLQDGLWKKFGVVVELDSGDSEERAWEIAVQEVEAAKKKYLVQLEEKSTMLNAEWHPPSTIDLEFQVVKDLLLKHEYREDALEYLENNPVAKTFRLNIELKNIINSKPSKQISHGS